MHHVVNLCVYYQICFNRTVVLVGTRADPLSLFTRDDSAGPCCGGYYYDTEGWVVDLEATNGSGVGEQGGTHEIHRDE